MVKTRAQRKNNVETWAEEFYNVNSYNQSHSVTENEEYVALGVWTTPWSNIFPWMADGYPNGMTDIAAARILLRKRCMLQDFLTLSDLYRTLAGFRREMSFCGISDCEKLSKSFNEGAKLLKVYFLSKNNANKEVFERLDEDAKKIYGVWNEIKFLRGAGLGLGVLVTKSTSSAALKNPVLSLDNKNHFPAARLLEYETHRVAFGGANYEAFAHSLKTFPFIGADQKIYAFGPCNTLLAGATEKSVIFSTGNNPLELSVNSKKRILENVDMGLEFHPIPFWAAENVDWRGRGYSTNLSAIMSLANNLDHLLAHSENQRSYTLSSDNWYPNWSPENHYEMRTLKAQYVGIIDEVENVFPSKQP